MTNSQRLATVRDRLIQWLAEHRGQEHADAVAQAGEEAIKQESILIRDGFYCGRRFDLGTHRAVWFLEEDEVKIYGSGGELLGVLSSQQISPPKSDPSDQTQIIRLTSPEGSSDLDSRGDHEIRRAA